MPFLRTTRQVAWQPIIVAAGALAVLAVSAQTATSAHALSIGQTKPTAYFTTNSNSRATCGAYIVQPGDTLGRIAGQYGTTWRAVAAANGLSNPNLIFPGQRLNVCGAAPATTSAASVPTAQVAASTVGEPCQSTVFATGPIAQWTVPPGCYAGIYRVDPSRYVARSGFGWCNWWPEVLHPANPNILTDARSRQPIPGAVAVFAPGDQGASSGGHYGEVVAVLNNGWVLISEMNFNWRGGGFGLVSYRYVRLDGGVTFIDG